jgi:hypothetical protein
MSRQTTAKQKAYVRLLQNPYAALAFTGVGDPVEATFEQKCAYLRKLENPHAYTEVFGEPAETPVPPHQRHVASPSDSIALGSDLSRALDEVLRLYKPYVARAEWRRVADYRSSFLERASRAANIEQIVARLGGLKFCLMPGEKVEQNRATAARIISELEKLLA